jgi:hypothetical protein
VRCLNIIASILLWSGSLFATTITVLPAAQNSGLGNQAIVSLNVDGLGSGVAPSVGTFDLDVAFDSSILAFNSAVFGNQLDILGLGDLQFVTPGLTTVNLFELSLDSASDLNSLQATAFILATLKFDTIGPGTSPIILSLNALGDADGTALPTTLVNGAVTVTSVPEPSSLFMIALTLSGFLVSGRLGRHERS